MSTLSLMKIFYHEREKGEFRKEGEASKEIKKNTMKARAKLLGIYIKKQNYTP